MKHTIGVTSLNKSDSAMLTQSSADSSRSLCLKQFTSGLKIKPTLKYLLFGIRDIIAFTLLPDSCLYILPTVNPRQ
jgi:hypothetical protein